MKGCIGEHGRLDRKLARGTLVENARLHIELLGRDPQTLCDLLQDLGARLAQPALDLAEVGIGDTRLLGELPQRQLCVAPLLAEELTQWCDLDFRHASMVHAAACRCKRRASR